MMILENIQDAELSARLFITDINNAYPARDRIKIFGTATKLKALESWEELFPRIIKFTPEKPKAQTMQILPRDLWEMGYCCDLFKRYFPSFLIPQLLEEEGKNPVMIEKSMSLLSRLQTTEPIFFTDRADEMLGKDAEAVREVVRRRLLAWVKDFRMIPCFALVSALADLGAKAEDNLVLDSICSDLINGTYTDIEKSIEDNTFGAIAGKNKTLLAVIKTQKALSCQNREEITAAFKDTLNDAGAEASPGIRSRLFSNAASYYLGICDTRAAADSIKEGMLLAQKENEGRGLARIYRIFSLVEFSNQRLSDAIDYFSFAIEHAEKAGNQTELGLSCYYSAVAHFIFGNISKAKQLAISAQKAALEALLPGWACRGRFLEGRFYFETGMYKEALAVFTELKTEFAESAARDFLETIEAWIFRAGVYLNKTTDTPKKFKGRDALLFKTEAAFICGEYRKTLELVKEMEKTEIESRFNFIEQPDWRSGFHQCELLLFSEQDLWSRMTKIFKALALCFMSDKEKTGEDYPGKSEAIREIQQMIRSSLPETDPNDAFYLYSYYRILKLTEAPDVDMNTAISLAFKRLQRRASRIEDNETKRAFLFTHYWNSALASAAKEHKLI
jgi:tetratricopeptide (TPR) repeat protein